MLNLFKELGSFFTAAIPFYICTSNVQIVPVLFFFFLFRAAPSAHKVPRLGVELELQLPVYSTATAAWDLHWILNPTSKVGIEPESSWTLVRFVTTEPGTPHLYTVDKRMR